MKKISLDLYEAGDHVMVTSGYNKNRIGIVLKHPNPSSEVSYKIAGKEYNEDNEDDDWDYDDDGSYSGDFDSSPSKFLKFISKKEYEDSMKSQKILMVPGLPVAISFKNNNFIIGDNVVTPTNALKISEFILQNKPKTKKKTR